MTNLQHQLAPLWVSQNASQLDQRLSTKKTGKKTRIPCHQGRSPTLNFATVAVLAKCTEILAHEVTLLKAENCHGTQISSDKRQDGGKVLILLTPLQYNFHSQFIDTANCFFINIHNEPIYFDPIALCRVKKGLNSGLLGDSFNVSGFLYSCAKM